MDIDSLNEPAEEPGSEPADDVFEIRKLGHGTRVRSACSFVKFGSEAKSSRRAQKPVGLVSDPDFGA